MYKYKRIKLKDGSTENEHRLVWIDHYGEIPKGMVIHHKNGDGRDNRIDNLEIMTLSEHSRIHNTGVSRPYARRPIPHGTCSGYQHHGCKCELCMQANRDRVQMGRIKRGGR